jgi:DNA-binding response OmpR family regulator
MERTILIIDDEERITRLLSFLLNKHGFKTIAATEPAKALEIAQSQRVDLIISDVMMPGINGFELAQKLKDNPNTTRIPLVFLTAKSDITDKFTGYFVGAAEFLTKPFKTEELLGRVKKIFEVDELEQALQITAAAETRMRPAAAASMTEEAAAPPAAGTAQSFVKISDVLNIYDKIMHVIDEEGRKTIDETAFDTAFEAALEKISGRHPALANLHLTPDGVNVDEAKRLVKKGNFEESNAAFCDLLKQFFEALVQDKDARNGVQIAVMDNDEETADFLDLVLTEAGFSVCKIAGESDLFDSLNGGSPPHLVLVNASMEGCDIADLCRRIRAEKSGAEVPILAISDWFDAEQVKTAFAAGVTDYLVKPFSNTELVSVVVNLLRK